MDNNVFNVTALEDGNLVCLPVPLVVFPLKILANILILFYKVFSELDKLALGI